MRDRVCKRAGRTLGKDLGMRTLYLILALT